MLVLIRDKLSGPLSSTDAKSATNLIASTMKDQQCRGTVSLSLWNQVPQLTLSIAIMGSILIIRQLWPLSETRACPPLAITHTDLSAILTFQICSERKITMWTCGRIKRWRSIWSSRSFSLIQDPHLTCTVSSLIKKWRMSISSQFSCHKPLAILLKQTQRIKWHLFSQTKGNLQLNAWMTTWSMSWSKRKPATICWVQSRSILRTTTNWRAKT